MTEIIVDRQSVHLRNAHISYIIGILPGGVPMHVYFGARLESANLLTVLRRFGLPTDGGFSMQECALDRTPHEYPCFGLGDQRKGAFAVRAADGTRTVDARVTSVATEDGKPSLDGLPATFGDSAKTLRLTLEDTQLSLRLTLLYTIFDDCDVVARSALFENLGEQPLWLERAMSLALDLPDGDWQLITLSGAWARERTPYRRALVPGEQSVGSVNGSSSLQTSPFMALARKHTTESAGEAIGFSLVYSGNFYAGVQVDQHTRPRALIGINDYDFEWKLGAGERFGTPEAVLAYSAQGLGGMSRQLHRLCAGHLVRGMHADKPRPILVNSWEAAYFDFDESALLALAKTAASVGVELFVLDDGWFGQRDDDTTSLGDWQPDRRKLPNGLRSLSDKVHAMGLLFGLWFEPEMISRQSELYRAHPDWALQVNGREPIERRHQLTLDLSRADVCEHVYRCVADRLEADGIDYVKWDMNRCFSNVGSSALPPERQRELPHRYMLGLYGVLERLQRDFPKVLFESCASGGGRFDMGMLYYMPQTWCSDNTDALARCKIQYGTSMAFPPFAMGAHVSAVPNHQTRRVTPLGTRGNVAASGCFGYELDLNALSGEELQEIKAQVERVKALRDTLFFGDFYRLRSPFEGNDAAWLIVSPDKREAVFTMVRALGRCNAMPPLVRLCGLDARRRYRVLETGESYGGDELTSLGLCVPLPMGDAASVSWTLQAEDTQA